jgi:hypothetical protein
MAVAARASWAGPPSRGLSNPRASAQARALYDGLWRLYGHKTLTGQQELGVAHAGPRVELDYIARVAGRLPALLGLDYMEPRDNAAVNARDRLASLGRARHALLALGRPGHRAGLRQRQEGLRSDSRAAAGHAAEYRLAP